MEDDQLVPVHLLCPSCGWDETWFNTEYEIYCCHKCNWNWETSEDLNLDEKSLKQVNYWSEDEV